MKTDSSKAANGLGAMSNLEATTETVLPVVVIGAGPVGLAAAAHLHARGLPFLVLEAGTGVGAAVREWAHVRMFSPWEFNVDPECERLLSAEGWQRPPAGDYPTGREVIERYLEPLAAVPALAPFLRLGHRVVAIGRRGVDKVKDRVAIDRARAEQALLVRVALPGGSQGQIAARAVLDASGTWGRKAPAGADGWLAAGESEAPIVYGIPDLQGPERELYAGRRVMVVGGGHSAMNALLDLIELARETSGTRIVWLIRGERPQYGGGAADRLSARGALGQRLADAVAAGHLELVTRFAIEGFENGDDGTRVVGLEAGLPATLAPVDRIVVATGLRPELGFLAELRVDLDPALECPRALAPLIDPNLHSCGSVPPHGVDELAHPETGVYLVGMKSYGRAPTFLLRTGYEQVRSVTAALAGDWEAARRVELVLPETGVCKVGPVLGEGAASGCCGGPAPAGVEACCSADAEAKSAGQEGCGCGAPKAASAPGKNATALRWASIGSTRA